jgi:hypothetical protein
LGNGFACCREQALISVRPFDSLKRRALTSNLADGFAPFKSRFGSFFWGPSYRTKSSLRARCHLLGPTLELTAYGGFSWGGSPQKLNKFGR